MLFAATSSTLVQHGFDALPFGYNADKNIFDFSISADVGYMHISHMEGISIKNARRLMFEFLAKCHGFKAIIIDVRDNQGGLPQVVDQITGAFISEKKQVFNEYKSKRKSHNAFGKVKPYYCKPISENPFTGKVVILTNDRTRSAGENFVMSLMDLPNVTIIGDRTEGMLGGAKIGFLPYGWIYGVNNYKVLSPDGINFEDVGIPPDIFIQNKLSDIENSDPVIEKVMEFIHGH